MHMPPIVTAAPRRTDLARSGRTRALLGIVLLCAPWLAGCAWLEQRQREIALRPSPTQAAHVEAASSLWRPGDQQETLVLTSGERLAVWWLPAAAADAPVLLYLHGTFRNLYQNAPKIAALRQAGFAVVAVDYRGWGDSSPRVPDEDSIQADAQRAWALLVQRAPVAARRVIYGHSMGGAVAVRLASTLQGGRDYGALVLESTFTRMPDVAAAAGFVGRIGAAFTTLEFDSLARIGRIDAPILMLHGDADRTVPVDLGRRLRDAAPPARVRWVEFAGGSHSRLQSEQPEAYQRELAALIAALPAPALAAAAPAPPVAPAADPAASAALATNARKTRPAVPAARTAP